MGRNMYKYNIWCQRSDRNKHTTKWEYNYRLYFHQSDELGGSGEINGMTNGDSITFTSPGDNDIMTGIQWEGVIAGEEINGTYLVNPSLHGISIGLQQQYGAFNAKRQ